MLKIIYDAYLEISGEKSFITPEKGCILSLWQREQVVIFTGHKWLRSHLCSKFGTTDQHSYGIGINWLSTKMPYLTLSFLN